MDGVSETPWGSGCAREIDCCCSRRTRADKKGAREAEMNMALLLDPDVLEDLIQERRERGIDLYDEVWDGVYVMPSMPSLPHQRLVHDLEIPLHEVVVRDVS